VIGGMVAATTFIAPHQTLWPHLCWENPWTVLSWLPQLTEDWERRLMGQALK